MKSHKSEQEEKIGTAVPIDKIGIGTRIYDISKRFGGVPGLAEVTRISESQLYRYVNGKSSPTLEPLVFIARAGGASLDWLVDGYGPRDRYSPPPEPPTATQERIVKAFRQFQMHHIGLGLKQSREWFARYWNERQFGPRKLNDEWVPPDLIREVPDLTAEQLEAWETALRENNAARERENRREEFDRIYDINRPQINEEAAALYVGDRRQGDDFVYVPRLDALVSAGFGTNCEQDEVRDRLAFRSQWIREMGLQAERLALVDVRGDSMLPTLAEGDLVLVDMSATSIGREGIYVLRLDGVLLVKRVQTSLTGEIYIRSDNPHYKEERIPRDMIPALRVVGRVVWLGRQI